MNRSIANWLATNPGGAVFATGLLGLLPFFGIGFFFFLPGAVPALLALARGPRQGAMVAAGAVAAACARDLVHRALGAGWRDLRVLGARPAARARLGAAPHRIAVVVPAARGAGWHRDCLPSCTRRSGTRRSSGRRSCASSRRRCSDAACRSTTSSSIPWRAGSGAGSRCSRCCSACARCSSRAGGSTSRRSPEASAPSSARYVSAARWASVAAAAIVGVVPDRSPVCGRPGTPAGFGSRAGRCGRGAPDPPRTRREHRVALGALPAIGVCIAVRAARARRRRIRGQLAAVRRPELNFSLRKQRWKSSCCRRSPTSATSATG